MKSVFVVLGLLLSGMAVWGSSTVTVTVSGKASGVPAEARELALTNALREAVRQGAGVDILSQSKVQNFTMEYDRVMTSSFGYIKSYKILSRKYYTHDNIYVVTLRAEVGKGSPQMNQVLALRMLLKRMQSPRLMVECVTDIAGVGGSGNASMGKMLIEELAQKSGFEIYRAKTIGSRNHREALRAQLLGDRLEAQVKEAGITSTSDFKIIAKISGEVGALREPFPEVRVRDVALGVDLQAVWSDTGEIIATVALPTTFHRGEKNLTLPYEMPRQLVRYYLNMMLTGRDPAFKNSNIYKLFRRIIAKWIVELDLGARVEMEFRAISKGELDKLLTALKSNPRISYVWLREFDRRLYSVVEVESRLPSKNLAEIVTAALHGKYQIDTMTKRRLRFVPDRQAPGKKRLSR